MGEREVLLALAERCEQATGPDSRLNADIFAALNSEWTHHQSGGDLFWRGSPYAPKTMRAPHYTSSRDAALTLVPEGMKWSCGFHEHVPHYAQVWTNAGFYEGECDSNRAIAVCIAALRALAAEAGDA